MRQRQKNERERALKQRGPEGECLKDCLAGTVRKIIKIGKNKTKHGCAYNMSCLFFFFSKTTLSQQLYLRIKIIYINNTQNALNSIQDSGSEDKKDESLVVCQLGASIIYKK